MTAEKTLSQDAQETLRRVAAVMIPAHAHYQVPGADDEAIFNEILAATQTATEAVSAALTVIDGLCLAQCSKGFDDLDDSERVAMLPELGESRDENLCLLVRLVVQCYYRDARVLQALQIPARPRFPDGLIVEQGDWSLLDPVKQRPKFYREV